jgi:hypothetical protein
MKRKFALIVATAAFTVPLGAGLAAGPAGAATHTRSVDKSHHESPDGRKDTAKEGSSADSSKDAAGERNSNDHSKDKNDTPSPDPHPIENSDR